jgi:8-oxo-dGTP pyrophosphatase MutT (NUDIX family)
MSIENNPWTTLSSDVKYDNPWIRVTEHQVLNPAGNPGIYGIVHFKNLAVGVVAYENGQIWLVGQYRFPLERYSWEIPEGGGPLHESALECAQRELKEETGLAAAHYLKIGEFDISNSVSDEKAVIFLATGLTHGESEPEETEQLAIRKVTLEEAFEMVEGHEIRDSLTVVAIYKMMILKGMGKLD